MEINNPEQYCGMKIKHLYLHVLHMQLIEKIIMHYKSKIFYAASKNFSKIQENF
jgi:hypothetical protein